jgi:cysteine synthase A
MAQKLAKELGLAVGISSGANVIGAIKLKEQLGEEAVVVTVLSDSNKKYLSTALVGDEPEKDGYLSSEVKFVDYQAICRLSNPIRF